MSDQQKATETGTEKHRTGVSTPIAATLLILIAAFGAVHYLVTSATAGQSQPLDTSPREVTTRSAIAQSNRMGMQPEPVGSAVAAPELTESDELIEATARTTPEQRFDAEQRRFQAQIDRLKRRVAELERKLHQRAENRQSIIRGRRQPNAVPLFDNQSEPDPAVPQLEERQIPEPNRTTDDFNPVRSKQALPSPLEPKPEPIGFDSQDLPGLPDESRPPVPDRTEPTEGLLYPPGLRDSEAIAPPVSSVGGTLPNPDGYFEAPGMDSPGFNASRTNRIKSAIPTPAESQANYVDDPSESIVPPMAGPADASLNGKRSLSDILCTRIEAAKKQAEELAGRQQRTTDDDERLAGAKAEIKVLAQQIAQQKSLVLQQVEQTQTTIKRMQDAMKSLKQAGFSDVLAEQRMNARISALRKKAVSLRAEAERLDDTHEAFEFDRGTTDNEPESIPKSSTSELDELIPRSESSSRQEPERTDDEEPGENRILPLPPEDQE